MNAATSAEVLELIQLLRATSYEDLELLWKQLSGNDEHRYLFALLGKPGVSSASLYMRFNLNANKMNMQIAIC